MNISCSNVLFVVYMGGDILTCTIFNICLKGKRRLGVPHSRIEITKQECVKKGCRS